MVSLSFVHYVILGVAYMNFEKAKRPLRVALFIGVFTPPLMLPIALVLSIGLLGVMIFKFATWTFKSDSKGKSKQ